MGFKILRIVLTINRFAHFYYKSPMQWFLTGVRSNGKCRRLKKKKKRSITNKKNVEDQKTNKKCRRLKKKIKIKKGPRLSNHSRITQGFGKLIKVKNHWSNVYNKMQERVC